MAQTMRSAEAELLQDELLATKLFMPPPRRNLVRRARLTERLSAGLHHPLTLVVAPAGWGKTTLLGDWRVEQQEQHPEAPRGSPKPSAGYPPSDTQRHPEHTRPIAWLALDEGDNDLARFLRYFIAALQEVHPDLGRPALASLRSPQPPSAEALLTLLLNDLANLPQDAVLILDDYHLINSSAIHRAVAFLLDHLPPQLHLVIATRIDPPLPLARLRARGHLTELRAADLGFTADEAAAFLNDTMGLHLSVDDVAALEARTEGWITGLHLAALSLRDREPQNRHDFITALSGTHRYILDYLAGEVFDHQPPEVQRFLLYTSILGGLNGSLCDAVLGELAGDVSRGGGQTMLEWLDDTNLFVVRLDDNRTWYRYHHLFAGFLRERLRRDRPKLIPELHCRASRWLEENGRLTYAAEHALAAEDYEQAARLIEQAIRPTIWQRGELITLQRWLERLPQDVTRTRPRLSLDLAWALLWSAQVEAIEPRLQDVEHAITSLPEAGFAAMRGEVAAIRAELARQGGEIATAIALARQALEDLPQDDRLARGATTGLLGQAYLLNGDAKAASQAFAEAVVLGQAPDTITLALIAGGRLVQAQALQGRLRQAAATYQQMLDLASTHGVPATPAVGVAQVYMGEVLREWNDLDAAEDLVRQGIAHCTQWAGLAGMALDGYVTLARLLQARGDMEGALAVLQQAEALGRECHVAQYAERVAVARMQLWLSTGFRGPALRAGDPLGIAAVTQWAGEREAVWRADENPGYVGLLERLMLARLHLVHGRLDDAAALLGRLLETAEAGGLMGCVIEILLLRAVCLQGQGQTAQAMIALTRALSLAEPQGYVRLFVDAGIRRGQAPGIRSHRVPELTPKPAAGYPTDGSQAQGAPIVRLLQEARSRGLAPAYVDALLAACGATGTAAGDDAALVEPLSARELELLRLLAAGLSTSEIAAQLFITTGTARNHLKNIYGKLEVHSRLQAVERARVLDLL
jgi:LuxR family maltose regulon positive regulatory protein